LTGVESRLAQCLLSERLCSQLEQRAQMTPETDMRPKACASAFTPSDTLPTLPKRQSTSS
jgi:hypothetical protein